VVRRFGVARSVADLCPFADRLPDIHHRAAADRDHDVPRQPPSAVSDTWYAKNLKCRKQGVGRGLDHGIEM
jgi:hypothetical protein